MITDADRQLAARIAGGLSPAGRAQLAAQLRAEATRVAFLRDNPTALHLSHTLDPSIVRTPALELLTRELHQCVATPGGRLVVSIPPQEGKSTLLGALCTWVLIENPNRRIVYASYAAALARKSGREVRSMIRDNHSLVGLGISTEHADAADWELAGHRGGMFCVGIGGGLTGRPAEVLVIDDPVGSQQDADSQVVRDGMHGWYSSVARTRLAPGAAQIIVQTRWHEDDLAGRKASEGWPVVNIPALADGKTPDALGRPPGTWLVSARGRTTTEWEDTKRDVGERTFAALYQGRPSPLEGGNFRTAWFDMHRVAELPAGCDSPTIVVDPADNEGTGDEAGIIVATRHLQTGVVYLIADLSARLTVAQWGRRALLAAIEHGAHAIAYERSLSGLRKRIKDAWDLLHKQATALRTAAAGTVPNLDHVPAAVEYLHTPIDNDEARQATHEQLVELVPLVDQVLAVPPAGPQVKLITARGSKADRARSVTATFETGRARMVGRLPQAEHQMATWQVGQDSPDRMDTVVHAVMLLSGAVTAEFARPAGQIPVRSTGIGAGGGQIVRSTRSGGGGRR
jgi:hypothetical protein